MKVKESGKFHEFFVCRRLFGISGTISTYSPGGGHIVILSAVYFLLLEVYRRQMLCFAAFFAADGAFFVLVGRFLKIYTNSLDRAMGLVLPYTKLEYRACFVMGGKRH